MSWDFYIYNRLDVNGNYITLHFSSNGLMQDHSSDGALIEAIDMKKAYDGFCQAYEFIHGEKYDHM